MQFKERLFQQDATISRTLPLELLEPTWTISLAQLKCFVGKLSDPEFAALFRCAPSGHGDERYKALLASRKGWLVEGFVYVPVKPLATFEAGIVYSFDDSLTVRALAYGETYETAVDMFILQASILRSNSQTRNGIENPSIPIRDSSGAASVKEEYSDCCSDPLLFAMRDKHHDFSIQGRNT